VARRPSQLHEQYTFQYVSWGSSPSILLIIQPRESIPLIRGQLHEVHIVLGVSHHVFPSDSYWLELPGGKGNEELVPWRQRPWLLDPESTKEAERVVTILVTPRSLVATFFDSSFFLRVLLEAHARNFSMFFLHAYFVSPQPQS
jgi:hypothetical protein